MEKLIEKVDNLITKIDDLDLIKRTKELEKEIESDKELLKLIEKYRITQDLELKEQIISNKLFSEYKHNEMELNLIIMGINQKLKKINNRSSCQKWK